MIKEDKFVYCEDTSSIHKQDWFEKMQVNQELGPLLSGAISMVKQHYELATQSKAMLIAYHFTIKLPQIGPKLVEPLAQRWFSIFLKSIDDYVRLQGRANQSWKVMLDTGIRCFWSNDCRDVGHNSVKVYIISNGHELQEWELFHLIRMDLEKYLRIAVNRCSKELFDGEVGLPVKAIISEKTALTLIRPDDEDYELQKGLLFYQLSALAAKPKNLTKDDLTYLSVLTSPGKDQTVQVKGDKSTRSLDVMYSSARTGENKQDKWQTPPEIFNQLNQQFGFTLDAAAEPETALCGKYFTEDDNALVQDWSGHIVFCNPPYSKLKAFAKKAYEESLKGVTVVMLVPARTDTKACHDYLSNGEIRFIKGRLKFLQGGKSQDAAPFPSMVCVLGPGVEKRGIFVEKKKLLMQSS
ncbi:DNA N-6-adenine-methyltransferase [Vibrio alginolyticus]